MEDKEPEKLGILEESKKIRDELRAENDRRERLLEEEKKLISERMLSGTAGGRVEAQSKPETPKEYAERVLNNKVPLK